MVYAPAKVRVVTPAVGGGFGAKSGLHGEEILLGGLAAALQRPVRWTETRSESMQALEHGRAQHHEVTLGGTRDGKVEAYRLTIVQDAGAYPGFAAIIPVMMTRTMAPSVYDIPRVECSAKSVVTNTTPTAAYRGAGRPEAVAATIPSSCAAGTLCRSSASPTPRRWVPFTTSETMRVRWTRCSNMQATSSCGRSSNVAATGATRGSWASG